MNGTLKLLLFCGLCFSSSLSWGQKPAKALTPSSGTSFETSAPKSVGFLLAFGSELRPEKDINGNYQEHALTNYALGFGFDQFVVILEKAEFKESSGNSTLNIERTLEDYLLWGQYRALSWNRLVPFMGLGLGSYKETVVTRFAGAATTDSTPNRALTGLSFGLGIDVPLLWFSLEGRILFGDQLERQPTLGGLARVGFHF